MNEAIDRAAAPSPSINYSLLLQRVEKLLIHDATTDEAVKLLGQETAWKRLPPEQALHWARLAQAAGLHELSLKVLAWTNEVAPDFIPAWQERVELLKLLGRSREAGELQGAGRNPSTAAGPKLSSCPEDDMKAQPDADVGAAFHSMRRQEEMLALYLNLFQGREDCFARQWADRKAGTQGYVPVRRPMEMSDVLEHVRGHRTYGIYLLQKDSRTRIGVIDADLVARFRSGALKSQEKDLLKREKSYLLERVPELSRKNGVPCLVEFSGGKGFHFWYLMADPVPAPQVRRTLHDIVRPVAADLSCFSLEVFPKQDQLAGKGLGNLVKLPLGVHRVTGRSSFFVHIADRSVQAQMAVLEKVERIPPQRLEGLSGASQQAEVVIHPRHQGWSNEYPELALLSTKCLALGQIMASCRQTKILSVREEKILLGTLGFLPRAKTLLHHLFQQLPEYNPHLVDYRLSRLRGTVLGCRRIHSLLNLSEDFCDFSKPHDYLHPLLHCPEWNGALEGAKAERVTNLSEALENLKHAIGMVQRFLTPRTNV